VGRFGAGRRGMAWEAWNEVGWSGAGEVGWLERVR